MDSNKTIPALAAPELARANAVKIRSDRQRALWAAFGTLGFDAYRELVLAQEARSRLHEGGVTRKATQLGGLTPARGAAPVPPRVPGLPSKLQLTGTRYRISVAPRGTSTTTNAKRNP